MYNWEDLPSYYYSTPLPTQGGAPPFVINTPAHDHPPTANHGASGGLVPTPAPPTVTLAHSNAGVPPALTAQLLHQVQTTNTHCPQDPRPTMSLPSVLSPCWPASAPAHNQPDPPPPSLHLLSKPLPAKRSSWPAGT